MFSNDPIPRPGRPPASSSPLADYLSGARHGVDSGYAVLPRSLAESMPLPWQQQMVHLLAEFHQAYGHLPWPVYRVVPSRYEFLVDLDEDQLAEVGCLVEIDGDGELVYRERNGARIPNPEDKRVLVSCLDPIPNQQSGFVQPAVAPRPVPPLPANEPATTPAPPPAPPPTPPHGEPPLFEFPPPPAPSPFVAGAGIPSGPPAQQHNPPLPHPPQHSPTPQHTGAQHTGAQQAGAPHSGTQHSGGQQAPPQHPSPLSTPPAGSPAPGFGAPPPGFRGQHTPPPGLGTPPPGMPGMNVPPGPQGQPVPVQSAPGQPVPGQRTFGPPPEEPEEPGYDQPFGPTGSGNRPNPSW
ncbi:hypothetical protein [Crossiella sp. CA198]|uniref:hypothetical protein n=1 Tax=Crossiella sp. CA198 TaxID=3455607 RepID=UPI003F8CF27C